jgi:uncharacterized protein YkwD
VGGAVAIAALFVGPQAARAGAGCPDEDLVPTAANAAQVEQAVLCALNRERRAAGLVSLHRAPKLDLSARFHTVAMVRGHFLAHEASGHPTLLARVRGFGYFAGARDGIYAENVGAGPSYHGTARSMVTAWMESAGHRANVLYARFRDVGISAVPAPPDPAFFAAFPSTVFTTDFGTRYVRRRCVVRRTTTVSSGSAAPLRRYCRAPASR